VLRNDLLVSDDEAGVRIDRYLTSVLGGHSRSQIQRLIKDGKVTIAGRAVPANRIVRAGEAIAIDIPEPVRPIPQPEDHD
jgi:23S rRNA pseudouridine1911/1915/1917 synthase